MELIDRKSAINAVLSLENCYNGFSDTYDKACIIGLLEELPKVDAEPVRHGHWIERYGIHDGTYYKCSVCNYNCSRAKENYCSDCGAKMDGGKSDERSN